VLSFYLLLFLPLQNVLLTLPAYLFCQLHFKCKDLRRILQDRIDHATPVRISCASSSRLYRYITSLRHSRERQKATFKNSTQTRRFTTSIRCSSRYTRRYLSQTQGDRGKQALRSIHLKRSLFGAVKRIPLESPSLSGAPRAFPWQLIHHYSCR
jgi:hypothetical protein